MSDNENNNDTSNVIGLVHSKEQETRFKLFIHFQSGEVEEYIGDFFGVSVENSSCFMIGKSRGEDIIPLAFIYIPLTKKILIEEVILDN